MLRDCFRCYWFIDEQNRFRVEHIQYFRNGGSYSGSPVVGIDLTTQQVSRNGKAWTFARDQYKFDKPDMAARYQFGWMDNVTQLFEGYPIDIISKYVNPDNIEQIDVSRFTSDIDYILLNPGDISKDGFVLLAAQYGGKINNLSFEQGSMSTTPGTSYSSAKIAANNIIRTDSLLEKRGNIVIGNFDNTGYQYNVIFFDENQRIVNSTGWKTDAGIYTVQSKFVCLLIAKNPIGAIIPSDADEINVSIQNFGDLILPYYNFVIDGDDHYLQNAYVAFCLLQQYYSFDMPAPLYSINGEQMMAQGIKKLKNQTIRFPVLNDPNLVQLVKTNLGDGVIEKMSVNLSSRNANATLKYDTE